MKMDFNSVLFALSYALDCVEHDVVGVATNHGKRVAALAIRLSRELGVLQHGTESQALAACAVMHDCALAEYVQEEFGGVYRAAAEAFSHDLGEHCRVGEGSMQLMPFPSTETANGVLYHHENVDGSGPFGKTSAEIPQNARLIQIADTVDAHYNLSELNDTKIEMLCGYLKNETGRLFPAPEAEAFATLLAGHRMGGLENENIDANLKELLPGGAVDCTPEQLIRFASVFGRIVDYKSHFTRTHSIGIAQKAHAMALFYGADAELAAQLYFAGALHDIGKLVVDRDILEKPGKLDAEEYRHIQTHAYYTYKILSGVPGLEEITKWASHHHEKLDGSGYPFGLTGDKLGKWERLIACLDIYQALTEERPYKKGMSHKAVIGMLQNLADMGKLDGEIVSDIDARFGGGKPA